ncbi:MAG: RidA family protein [Chloroflexi bacterium]|nr:RidA family protein [Chloroflexota bacterium]MCL5274686.1 RidA family protein [Chloroflexota bacterium]
MSRQVVQTESAPKAIGPYSQAIVANGMVFCAGQVPLDVATGNVVEGGIEAQTRQVFNNISAVLKAAGADLKHVVKTTVFLQNMGDFAAMNTVYGAYFTENPPARSAVEVAKLPRAALVEIEVIAVLP